MLIHEILEVEEETQIFLAEESLADLINLPVTLEAIDSGLDFEEVVRIGEGLGIALRLTDPMEFWLVLTDRYSGAKVLENIPTKRVVKSSEEEFQEALVEYFATSLSDELFCESCIEAGPPLHVQSRIERLEEFLRPILPPKGKVMEICCGNGMTTQSLRRLGFDPWTEDVEKCEVCQALKAGFLNPKKTMLLDARQLGSFFGPEDFDIVAGFMVGLIDDVNRTLWQEILLEGSKLAKKMVVYTTYTKPEAEWVAETLGKAGWQGEVIDNRDDFGIYDQWAYVAKR